MDTALVLIRETLIFIDTLLNTPCEELGYTTKALSIIIPLGFLFFVSNYILFDPTQPTPTPRMVCHPKSPLRFVKKYKSIQYKKQHLDGLTTQLHRVFYPKYQFDKATIDHNPKVGTDKKSVDSDADLVKKNKHIKGSVGLGNGFDTAVGSLVRLFNKYDFLTIDHFLHPEKFESQLKKYLTTPDLKSIVRLCKRKNPYLRMYLNWLKQKRVIPIASEYVVGIPDMELGTKVDNIVMNIDTKEHSPVEFKCGYEGYMFKSTVHAMNAPFNKLPDYPNNQHQLQVAQTRVMYDYTVNVLADSPPIRVGPGYYLNFHSNGMTEYPTTGFMTFEQKKKMQTVLMNRPKLTAEEKKKLYASKLKQKKK